jgi:hypothetical protein
MDMDDPLRTKGASDTTWGEAMTVDTSDQPAA